MILQRQIVEPGFGHTGQWRSERMDNAEAQMGVPRRNPFLTAPWVRRMSARWGEIGAMELVHLPYQMIGDTLPLYLPPNPSYPERPPTPPSRASSSSEEIIYLEEQPRESQGPPQRRNSVVVLEETPESRRRHPFSMRMQPRRRSTMEAEHRAVQDPPNPLLIRDWDDPGFQAFERILEQPPMWARRVS